MKKIWIYRHGPKESGSSKNVVGLSMTLSKEGREVTSKIATQFLADNGKPQMIRTSLSVRTYETGMIFAEVCNVDLPKIEANLTGAYQEWERVIGLVSGELTALNFYKADSSFVLREATSILETLRVLACELELGENAICFSHGGLIEPTVALAKARICGKDTTNLTKTFPKDLKEGEAAVFVFDKNNKLIDVQ